MEGQLDSQSRWLTILGKLRVNRSQGLAPHKPLLLLVVLEMIENGDLRNPVLKLTPELAFRFSQFGTVVAHRRTQRMDSRLPFYHLSSDTVWSAFSKDGSQSLDPKSTQYVTIDAEFFALAQDPTFRTLARVVLIRTYFDPAEQDALASLVNISISEIDNWSASVRETEVSYQSGRDVRFRLDIGEHKLCA